MIKLAKLKFWSFLVFGVLFLLTGIFFLVTSMVSQELTEMFIIAGAGQLVIFYGLLFYLYKGKIKNAMKA